MSFARRLLLFALSQVFAPVIGFGFTVEAGGKTCFDETVKSSERVSGDWRVLSGGILDLDVEVLASAVSISTRPRPTTPCTCRDTSTAVTAPAHHLPGHEPIG